MGSAPSAPALKPCTVAPTNTSALRWCTRRHTAFGMRRISHDVTWIARRRYIETIPHVTGPGRQRDAMGTNSSVTPKCT